MRITAKDRGALSAAGVRWLAGAAIAVVACLGLWLGSRDRGPAPAARDAGAAAALPGAPGRDAAAAEHAPPPASADAAIDPALLEGIPAASLLPLESWLQQAGVDGSLDVDAQGHFRAGPATVRLFEYFRFAARKESADVMRGRIVLEIRKQLAPGAREEAIDVLDRYLALQDATVALLQADPHLDPLQGFEKVRALRRRELGPELAEALFGEEENLERFRLYSRAAAEDPSLRPEEREARIRELERRLPQPIWEARRRKERIAQTRAQVDELRESGASDAQIFAARERALGRPTAEAFARLDAQRAQWAERFAAYRAEREQLLAAAPLSDEERAARIDALRRARFKEEELNAVDTQDVAADQAAAMAAAADGAVSAPAD